MFNKKKFLLIKQCKNNNLFMFIKKNNVIFFFENLINLNLLIFKGFKFLKLYNSYIFNYLICNFTYKDFIMLLNLIFLTQDFKYGFLRLKFNYLFLSYCKFYNYLLYNLFLKKLMIFIFKKTDLFFFFFFKKINFVCFLWLH